VHIYSHQIEHHNFVSDNFKLNNLKCFRATSVADGMCRSSAEERGRREAGAATLWLVRNGVCAVGGAVLGCAACGDGCGGGTGAAAAAAVVVPRLEVVLSTAARPACRMPRTWASVGQKQPQGSALRVYARNAATRYNRPAHETQRVSH
jgi:hypothetical protein